MKKIVLLSVMVVLLLSLTVVFKAESRESIVLATTTSAENSGLLAFLLPDFEEAYGVKVKVVAVGSGKALRMGMEGEADVLLVHSKDAEESFMDDGYGIMRSAVMYNEFILVGPKEDPASLKGLKDIALAYKKIADSECSYLSRGDESGTHVKERTLLESLGISPSSRWYLESGQGMGATLQMASELMAYTLTDRATYLSMSSHLDLEVIVEDDRRLFNQYSVILVNRAETEKEYENNALLFYTWLVSEKTQNRIATFGQREYGQQLFVPNADHGDQ
ncbi:MULTISPECIES: substrate-binding domain-containing protein [unclassified Fusibacter]|uniref:substrate-binding domain-containing protein n=1 Tax=unclassified Fusibacter TaxID=2624464 RepID=UPI001012E322|nr:MULTISPECIES: substrate-binding domain-containing protein [unclassified Fusibacter]MCK8058538.1 substrate-binding domain-containing protein [Fusibacter sp. A2]NPE22693.1 solute-binding protein [Fusibacter sp. A1]RXV60253.1 tungsten ABC transporter substrate-binding protein [Fusibacter sp. A1]